MAKIDQINEKISRRSYPNSASISGMDSHIHGLPENVALFIRNNVPYYSATNLHHRFVLLICLSGSGEIVVENKKFSLVPGLAILIFPFQSHYYSNAGSREEKSWCYITFELSEIGGLDIFRSITFNIPATAWDVLDSLLDRCFELNESNPAGITMVSHLTGLLLATFLYEKNLKTITLRESIPGNDDIIAKTSWYIMKNLDRRITIAEIAKKMNISEPSLRRIFRERTHGLSLGKFINRMRMFKAYELLCNTNLSVAEIAERAGFSSTSTFSRAMRKLKNSPTEYRKKHGRFK